MNVASLSLSSELNELTGWYSDVYWAYGPNGEKSEGYKLSGMTSVPAYDLGYLLRRLPDKIPVTKINNWLHLHTLGDKIGWCAHYSDAEEYKGIAETAEDALCRLAIHLIKEGLIDVGEK